MANGRVQLGASDALGATALTNVTVNENERVMPGNDATALMADGHRFDGPILIDQGAEDSFLAEQLRPELFQAACDAANQPLLLRQHAGYDHSYWFIQSFIEDHLRHHARVLSP